MSKLETNQVDPSTGTTLTLGTSGDTIAIPSGVTITNSGTANNFGGVNTPAFFAYLGSNQNISNATNTTVAFNAEIFDTANGFDTSTHKYTIPSGQGGKYFITVSIRSDNWNAPRFNFQVLKNDSGGLLNGENSDTGSGAYYNTVPNSALVSLAAGDVIHVLVYHNNGSTKPILGGQANTFFGAYKLIE